MSTYLEVQRAADQLNNEERAGLVAHLLASFSSAPMGPDDDEIDHREMELDSGSMKALSHEEFLSAVGARRR